MAAAAAGVAVAVSSYRFFRVGMNKLTNSSMSRTSLHDAKAAAAVNGPSSYGTLFQDNDFAQLFSSIFSKSPQHPLSK